MDKPGNGDWNDDWEAAFRALRERKPDPRPLAEMLKRGPVPAQWAMELSHLLDPDSRIGYRLVMKTSKAAKKRAARALEREICEAIQAQLAKQRVERLDVFSDGTIRIRKRRRALSMKNAMGKVTESTGIERSKLWEIWKAGKEADARVKAIRLLFLKAEIDPEQHGERAELVRAILERIAARNALH